MNDPSQQKKPEDHARDKEKDRGEKTPLHQLAESRNKKTGQCSNHIAGRALPHSCHGANKRLAAVIVYPDKPETQLPRSRDKSPVVERPGTSGRILISAPLSASASRSSGSSDSGV